MITLSSRWNEKKINTHTKAMSSLPPPPEEEGKQQSSLEQACTCWICFELFEEPITLACGHTLCKNCLINVFKTDPECPYCRRPFGLPFPEVNEGIEALVTKYKAERVAAAAAAGEGSGKKGEEAKADEWDEAMSGPKPQLLRLPDTVLNKIMVDCGPESVVALSEVSRALHEKAKSPFVWREFCRARWPFVTIDKYRNWRSCYAAHHTIMRGWSSGRPGDFRITTFRGHKKTTLQILRCATLSSQQRLLITLLKSGMPPVVAVVLPQSQCEQWNGTKVL